MGAGRELLGVWVLRGRVGSIGPWGDCRTVGGRKRLVMEVVGSSCWGVGLGGFGRGRSVGVELHLHHHLLPKWFDQAWLVVL